MAEHVEFVDFVEAAQGGEFVDFVEAVQGGESKGENSVSLCRMQTMQTHPALQLAWHKFETINSNQVLEAEIHTPQGIRTFKAHP